ncbi:hypothetical protein pb186bvf_020647 [Paramecium bursaria]
MLNCDAELGRKLKQLLENLSTHQVFSSSIQQMYQYEDQINETCLCHSCNTCFYSDEYSRITCSYLNYR